MNVVRGKNGQAVMEPFRAGFRGGAGGGGGEAGRGFSVQELRDLQTTGQGLAQEYTCVSACSSMCPKRSVNLHGWLK